MRLLEFQAKRFFAQYGIAVPRGVVVADPETIGSLDYPTVLKAQVPVGGRGKAGAIRRAATPDEAHAVVRELLGTRVRGYGVSSLLAEAAVDVRAELYLALLIDRNCNRLLLMASSEGGVEIEKVACEHPERIVRQHIDPLVGIRPHLVRQFGQTLGIADRAALGRLLTAMAAMMHDLDATLIEINPLAVTPDGIMALDAKMVLDDQARFRHGDLFERLAHEQPAEDTSGISPAEKLAAQQGLNYVPLDGRLGMIADGAGTGMLTMDLICDAGGRPANFCEMGGKSDAAVMQQALEVIAADNRVTAILVSLIGGLTRMDEMARGIVNFLKAGKGSVPLVVRMCGTRAEVGIPLLQAVGVDVHEDLTAAVQAAVACAKER